MDDRGPMARATAFALQKLPDDPKTAAVRALARQYAGFIDQAATPTAFAEALERLQAAAVATDDKPTLAAYRRVAAALSAVTVLSDLGPKLLAALSSLGMTAQQAPAPVPPRGGGAGADPIVKSTLANLRGQSRGPRNPTSVHTPAA